MINPLDKSVIIGGFVSRNLIVFTKELKTPPRIRANIDKYNKTAKGKAAHNRAQQNYRAKHKGERSAYDQSPKGRAVNKKAVAKYAKTTKGKAARERATINHIIKKSKEDLNARINNTF
jgi:hypothetical protein